MNYFKIIFISLSLALSSLHVDAKKANSLWFFLSPTSLSLNKYSSNTNLYGNEDVQMLIMFGNMIIPNRDEGIPGVKIMVVNKMGKPISIDYSKLNLLLNGRLRALIDVTNPLSTKRIVIPPASSYDLFSNTEIANDLGFLELFRIGDQHALPDVIRFFEGGMGEYKRWACVAYPRNDIQSGEMITFEEGDTPFIVEFRIPYAIENSTNNVKNLEISFYVDRIVGSRHSYSPFSKSEYNIVKKSYQEMDIHSPGYFNLWIK